MRTLATISAAFLFFFLAVSVPAFSQESSDHAQTRDEKARGDDKVKSKDDDKTPKSDDKAMKQDDRGMKRDETKRDENRPDARDDAPAAKSQHDQVARPDQRQEDHADHDRRQRPVSAERGERIPDDKFREHFGREHHFHVDRARIVNQSQPVIVYGGYSFELVDPWPVEWSYDDDCYIDYVDDGYYLFDVLHPGIRIAVIVLG